MAKIARSENSPLYGICPEPMAVSVIGIIRGVDFVRCMIQLFKPNY